MAIYEWNNIVYNAKICIDNADILICYRVIFMKQKEKHLKYKEYCTKMTLWYIETGFNASG
jgi:hypothetical protein